MSAPASDHQAARTALDEAYDLLMTIGRRVLAERAAPTDTAAPARPLGAGARPTTHDDRVSRPRDNAVVEEDDRHEHVTSTDA